MQMSASYGLCSLAANFHPAGGEILEHSCYKALQANQNQNTYRTQYAYSNSLLES